MRQRFWIPPVVALALWMALAALTPAQAAGLLVADGGLGGRLEIVEHDVQVSINNGIAVTTVTQVFRNLEQRQVEALYTFPVPKGASVANFSMWIGGQEMIGEVVEKERARQIYNSYKPQRRDPGLLEQTDFKTFEMRIFPIGPGAEQQVQIAYYQELEFDNDRATYVYPLATTAHEGKGSRTQGRFALSLDLDSEVPVVELGSPSHTDDFAVVKHSAHQLQASLETRGGDLNRDVVLSFVMSRPRTGLDLVTSMDTGEDGYFLMTLTAGKELDAARDDGMDYVFVLDISGSMDEDGKLSLSRNSINAFIESLGDKDRFELLTFNVSANNLFQELSPAVDAAKREAEAFLGQQRPKGGTVLEPAIRAAYRYKDADRPLNVVILSDGMTDASERQTLLELIGNRPGNTRVFAIGVGNEVNRPLLEQMAEDAGGLAAFISRGDDFSRQAQAFRRKLLRPAITDVEIEIEGGGIYDVEPERLPSLYHGAPIRMYGRYRDPGSVLLTLRGNIGGEEFEQAIPITLPGEEANNPELERMWAWHRVQRLLKDADRKGSRNTVIDEIVRLGEGFSIVTEYTSFLVLENDEEYRRWKIDRRNALRVARDRKAQQRVRDRLADLRRNTELGPMRDRPVKLEPKVQPPAQNASRGFDVNPGGGNWGGGAFDPLTLGIVAGLGGLSAAAYRRRRRP